MAPLKCCVGGCESTSDSHRLFSVPKDDNVRNLWMSFLVPTNPLLIGLSKDQLIRKRVCHLHFERNQLDAAGGRIRLSFPNLFSEKEIAHGIPLNSEEFDVLAEHSYHKVERNDNDESDALVINKADDTFFNEHSYSSCSSSLVNNTPALNIKDITETVEFQYSCRTSSIDEAQRKVNASICSQLTKDAIASCTSATGDTKQKRMGASISSRKHKASTLKQKINSKKRRFIQEAKTLTNESLGESAIQRIEQAKKMAQNTEFFKNFDSLNKSSKTFLMMQLKLARKNKMGRRFNMDEKLIALSFMKQSPKGYKLMEKMFALPSKRTLNRLSERICFEPGVNQKVFKYVHEVTKSWDTEKKLCTITFDEVALSPHLTFNEAKDVIDGFVELQERKLKYCDHALVFMIRGICSPWRQALAYYFCEGTVSAGELMTILKEIVAKVVEVGLKPLGLVCDQGATFRAALNMLRQDTIRLRNLQKIRDDGTIQITDINLYIFYDPPHLLKSIRNNFITKDIIFEGRKGTWKDIMFIFEIDSNLGHTRAMPKLTAHHVIPNKIKKMKVNAAAQVLSARTAAMLNYTNALNLHHKSNIESTMSSTAAIVEFFDKLFDSVNGSPGSAKRGKLRSAVKKNSPHIDFWQEAIKKMKNIKFCDTSSKMAIQTGKPRNVRVPCLDGWVTTLESFLNLSKLLLDKYGVDYFYPRCINQDPLENFFGRIRALNYRNVNPDAHTFKCSFKSLIISNMLSPHSRFCNCEEDNGETIVDLNFLFHDENNENNEINNKQNHIPSVPQTNPLSSLQESEMGDIINKAIFEKIRVQCSAYTAGYLCRKINKFINCKACRRTITTAEIDSIHKYIAYREYKLLKGSNLQYPNEKFLILYREAAEHIHSCLNMFCHQKGVGNKIKTHLRKKLRFSWLGCKAHKNNVQNEFFNLVTRLQIHNWVKIINKIFKGDIEERFIKRMGEPQGIAYKKYIKIRLRKKVLKK